MRVAALLAVLVLAPAGISDTVPGLFLRLVNEALKGRIDPRAIRFEAPSSVVLEDAVLSDPAGAPVARVKRARATISLSSLLIGEVAITRIDLVEPLLLLELKDGKLNLIEALSPKKPPDKKKPPKAAFRIDAIEAKDGGFRFTDGKNVTVTADDVDGTASLEMDLARELFLLDVKDVRVTSGAVKLPDLDVPIVDVKGKRALVFTDRVELLGVTGRAAGVGVSAQGTVRVKQPGSLALHGSFDAPANAWPDRLARLPFATPRVTGKVSVSGPFEDVVVHVDGRFEGAELYGYQLGAGRGVVDVNKQQVRIREGSEVKVGSGVVRATGALTLEGKQLALDLRALDVPLAEVLRPAKAPERPAGSVEARASISGVADGKGPLVIEASGRVRRALLYSVKPPPDVEVSAKVAVRADVVTLERGTLTAPGVSARVKGDVLVKEERLKLVVGVEATGNALAWVPDVPGEVTVTDTRFDGTITGPYKGVHVVGEASSGGGVAYGVPFADVRGKVDAGAAEVVVDGLGGTVAHGALQQLKPIVVELEGKKRLRGAARVRGARLAELRAPDGEALPLAGLLDVEAWMAGPAVSPTVTFAAAAAGVTVAGERLDQTTARGTVGKERLVVEEVRVRGALIDAHAQQLTMALPSLQLAGTVDVAHVDLAQVAAARDAKLAGSARGSVALRGDARAPTLDGALMVTDLAIGGEALGSGALKVGLAPDGAIPAAGADSPRHLATVVGGLTSSAGGLDVTAAYAIEREVVNAKLVVDNLDLERYTRAFGEQVAPLQGYAAGTVSAWGPLDRLTLRAQLRVPQLAVTPVRPADDTPERARAGTTLPLLRSLGAVLVDARMDEGQLDATVCAFPTGTPERARDEGSPCGAHERVWARLAGDLDVRHGSFDLGIDGYLDEPALEDLVPALGENDLALGLRARASAQLIKAPAAPLDARAAITLLAASVRPPASLRADLVGTSELTWADDRLTIARPLQLRAPSGEVDVVVKGSVGTEDVALDVQGDVALVLAKLFTTEIANAGGTAEASLTVRGRYQDGVVLDGILRPHPGSTLTPRLLGTTLRFQEGQLEVRPVDGERLRLTAAGLRASVGDGEVILVGDTDLRIAREAEQGWFTRWNLAMSATGIDLALEGARIEGAADLVLEGTEEAPLLRGRVEVLDGTYARNFELRNFVLKAPAASRSTPLWEKLEPLGLADLALDVDVDVQSLRARAAFASFKADLETRGKLALRKTLRLPQLDGAIEVSDGTIDVPRTRFEVQELQLQFLTTGDGRINPELHLAARAEIPPGGAGSNDTEIPVELTLDGDLEEGIQLDITATDANREWSRSDLFALIVFGRTLETDVSGLALSTLLRAAGRDVAAPVTDELASMLASTLGMNLELDLGGLRWQLGRRLQVEGSFVLQQQLTTDSSTLASGAASSVSTDAFRVRLLIVDHLPTFLGRNLSLDGRSGSGGSDLRLSLRLFEQ
ncbi:MAG: translocation/assembly module TamB domain-containing protein [Deltaproteobacteria bacterium]|nr:translocation/assembly module TamB domain-containing protein [Deltaproteobacteria bacterium]